MGFFCVLGNFDQVLPSIPSARGRLEIGGAKPRKHAASAMGRVLIVIMRVKVSTERLEQFYVPTGPLSHLREVWDAEEQSDE